MDTGKENDAQLLQRWSSSAGASRLQGVKSVLNSSTKKTAEVARRKPLGSVQNIRKPSANEDKGKIQKDLIKLESGKDVGSKTEKSSGRFSAVNALSNDVGPCSDSGSTSAVSQRTEYEDIEHMHREIDNEDDFSDLCAVADQPASYINDLLNWYPCYSYRPRTPTPTPEYSVSPVTPPDWKRKNTRSEELIEEPVIPELRLLDD